MHETEFDQVARNPDLGRFLADFAGSGRCQELLTHGLL